MRAKKSPVIKDVDPTGKYIKFLNTVSQCMEKGLKPVLSDKGDIYLSTYTDELRIQVNSYGLTAWTSSKESKNNQGFTMVTVYTEKAAHTLAQLITEHEVNTNPNRFIEVVEQNHSYYNLSQLEKFLRIRKKEENGDTH